MLAGPIRMEHIDTSLTAKSAGVYILTRDGKTAAYAGRSDFDLAGRIKQHISDGLGYTHFWYEYSQSSSEAFLKECEYYHKYRPPDNKSHPVSPSGLNLRCPIIGCPWA